MAEGLYRGMKTQPSFCRELKQERANLRDGAERETIDTGAGLEQMFKEREKPHPLSGFTLKPGRMGI